MTSLLPRFIRNMVNLFDAEGIRVDPVFSKLHTLHIHHPEAGDGALPAPVTIENHLILVELNGCHCLGGVLENEVQLTIIDKTRPAKLKAGLSLLRDQGYAEDPARSARTRDSVVMLYHVKDEQEAMEQVRWLFKHGRTLWPDGTFWPEEVERRRQRDLED